MPTFAYEAIREPGEPVKGEIEADDPNAAAASLLNRGYHVLAIKDANALEAGTMIMVTVAVMTQLIADVVYTFLNPKIRYE